MKGTWGLLVLILQLLCLKLFPKTKLYFKKREKKTKVKEQGT